NNPNFDTPGSPPDMGANNPAFFPTHKWNGTPANQDVGIYKWGGGIYTNVAVSTVGFMDNASSATEELWQKTGAVFENGTYTLSVLVGQRIDSAFAVDAQIRLYAGTNVNNGTLLKQQSVAAPASGSFELRTMTF